MLGIGRRRSFFSDSCRRRQWAGEICACEWPTCVFSLCNMFLIRVSGKPRRNCYIFYIIRLWRRGETLPVPLQPYIVWTIPSNDLRLHYMWKIITIELRYLNLVVICYPYKNEILQLEIWEEGVPTPSTPSPCWAAIFTCTPHGVQIKLYNLYIII